jgi:hypothetical protein
MAACKALVQPVDILEFHRQLIRAVFAHLYIGGRRLFNGRTVDIIGSRLCPSRPQNETLQILAEQSQRYVDPHREFNFGGGPFSQPVIVAEIVRQPWSVPPHQLQRCDAMTENCNRLLKIHLRHITLIGRLPADFLQNRGGQQSAYVGFTWSGNPFVPQPRKGKARKRNRRFAAERKTQAVDRDRRQAFLLAKFSFCLMEAPGIPASFLGAPSYSALASKTNCHQKPLTSPGAFRSR